MYRKNHPGDFHPLPWICSGHRQGEGHRLGCRWSTERRGEGFARLQLSPWKNVVGWQLWLNALGEKLSIWIHWNCDGAGKPNWTPKPLRNGRSCFAKAALTMWMSLKVSRATAWKDEMARRRGSKAIHGRPNPTWNWILMDLEGLGRDIFHYISTTNTSK